MRTGVANRVGFEKLASLQGVVDIAFDDVTMDEQCPRAALRSSRIFHRIVDTDMEMRISVRATQVL
jgi:hypothetical protein